MATCQLRWTEHIGGPVTQNIRWHAQRRTRKARILTMTLDLKICARLKQIDARTTMDLCEPREATVVRLPTPQR
jgi:hypothetical protein